MKKNETASEGEEKKIDMKKEVSEFLLYLLIMIVAVFCIIHFVGQRTQVHGQSMYPTLENGDNLIVDKISYRFKDPERYDIVVFSRNLDGQSEHLIKRIIGMPGETVWVDEMGQIYIDGEVLDENYGYEPVSIEHRYLAAEPITLGADEYFVMGDNRNNSRDSRDPAVGNIGRKELEGRAWVRIFPFSKFGKIEEAGK